MEKRIFDSVFGLHDGVFVAIALAFEAFAGFNLYGRCAAAPIVVCGGVRLGRGFFGSIFKYGVWKLAKWMRATVLGTAAMTTHLVFAGANDATAGLMLGEVFAGW